MIKNRRKLSKTQRLRNPPLLSHQPRTTRKSKNPRSSVKRSTIKKIKTKSIAKTRLTVKFQVTRTASTKTSAPTRRRNPMEMTTISISKPTKNGVLNTPTVRRTQMASLRMTAKNLKKKLRRKIQETTEEGNK